MAWAKNGTPDTLTGTGSALEITDLTAQTFNQFMTNQIVNSGNVLSLFTFNNNTNSVYAVRNSNNGGSDYTAINQAGSQDTSPTIDTVGEQSFTVMYTCSVSGQEKLSMWWSMNTDSGTGEGYAPQRREEVFKFVPSPDVGITSIEHDNHSSGSMAIGTNLSALGSDGVESMKVQDGAVFYETDTNKSYVLYNTTWSEL